LCLTEHAFHITFNIFPLFACSSLLVPIMTDKGELVQLTTAELTAESRSDNKMGDKEDFTRVTVTEVTGVETAGDADTPLVHTKEQMRGEAYPNTLSKKEAKAIRAREKKQQHNRERNKRRRKEAEQRTGLDWTDTAHAESFVIDSEASATAVGICAKDFTDLDEKTKRDLYYCICEKQFH
jgi:hypothetical protein